VVYFKLTLFYNQINETNKGDNMTRINIEKVKSLREQHGFSQKYVSDFLGYTAKGAYNQIEKGKKQPSVSRLGLLAKLYEVKVDDLLTG